jgi:hypothetical protein
VLTSMVANLFRSFHRLPPYDNHWAPIVCLLLDGAVTRSDRKWSGGSSALCSAIS